MPFGKILVTGASGMLGQDLIPYLQAKGYDVAGTTTTELNLLETADSIRAKVMRLHPQIIIHAAAYTNVDGAEADPELAMAINNDGTQKLALVARELGAIFAYISTDYVFDGLKTEPYTVEDRPNPINTYGLSKYYGEVILSELLEEYYIIRTSWLYGIHGKNFVRFVLESARQGRTVSIVDDQYGSPTWTGTLSHLIERIVTSGAYGTYHASDAGRVSRYEQALTICKSAGLSQDHIRPIPSTEFSQPANRPQSSALDCGELPIASWETALQSYLTQYLNPHDHAPSH
jgi:dTDP-4-dehydrorhamnose reductase